jgi:CHAD domain-containing protein
MEQLSAGSTRRSTGYARARAIVVRHVVFSDAELTPSIETEWQFDAVHLAPVQRWLGQHAEGTIRVEPAGTRSLVDTYLDTSDLRIYRAQRSLRLRRIGRRTEITLKTHAPAVAGVRSREEITEHLPVPDVGALGTDGEVGWRVRALIGGRQLTEIFEVRTRRQVFMLQHGALRAGEVVLDRTVIGIGPRLEPARLRRVEVEVADATEPEIAAFVERLRQECGLQLATHTKFEAGFLARGLEVPLPRDFGSTSFDLRSSTGELAFAVLRGLFVEMLAHESGTRLGEDPEELHGMRVATRRLRAVLGIFQPALPVRASRFRADLGWLGQVLGAVRDLDVEVGRLRGGADEAVGGEDVGAFDALIGVLESRRSEARATLLEALDARRYYRLVDGFAAFLAHGPLRRSAASAAPAAATVPRIAIERYRKVRKQGRRLGASSEPGEFHVLRIRCKRLRYALEAVAELYGKPVRVMNRRLIALQDALGSHQDAIVASQRLRSLAIDEGHDLPLATVFAMGERTARYTDRAERLRSEFPPLFRKLAGPWKELRRVMEAAAPQ